jgi:hypothetical protein
MIVILSGAKDLLTRKQILRSAQDDRIKRREKKKLSPLPALRERGWG